MQGKELPPNRELVVYALSTMGSIADRFHTEEIAIRCHELFQSSFSWTTRPDLPDKDIVRVALTDARKERYGALVEGRSGQSRGQYHRTRRGPMLDGWSLTEAGLEWIRANQERIERFLDASHGHEALTKDHRQKSRKRVRRILDHDLFDEFLGDAANFNPGIGQLADLARCRVDAEPAVWLARFEKIRRLGLETQEADVARFADACVAAYERRRE